MRIPIHYLLLLFLLLFSQQVAAVDVNWSQLTADELSALSPNTIASASSDNIRSIPVAVLGSPNSKSKL